jgi:hypothetical protein
MPTRTLRTPTSVPWESTTDSDPTSCAVTSTALHKNSSHRALVQITPEHKMQVRRCTTSQRSTQIAHQVQPNPKQQCRDFTSKECKLNPLQQSMSSRPVQSQPKRAEMLKSSTIQPQCIHSHWNEAARLTQATTSASVNPRMRSNQLHHHKPKNTFGLQRILSCPNNNAKVNDEITEALPSESDFTSNDGSGEKPVHRKAHKSDFEFQQCTVSQHTVPNQKPQS